MDRKKSVPAWCIGLILCLVLAGIGLVGCETQQPANTPKSTPTVPSAAGQIHCGAITLGPTGQLIKTSNADQIGQCFWQAYKKCQAASLIVARGGVDTVTTRTFTVEQRSTGCALSDAVQLRVLPRPANGGKTYTCGQVASTDTALLFSNCGADGNISVPLK